MTWRHKLLRLHQPSHWRNHRRIYYQGFSTKGIHTRRLWLILHPLFIVPSVFETKIMSVSLCSTANYGKAIISRNNKFSFFSFITPQDLFNCTYYIILNQSYWITIFSAIIDIALCFSFCLTRCPFQTDIPSIKYGSAYAMPLSNKQLIIPESQLIKHTNIVNTLLSQQNGWPTFCKRHSQMHFR